MVRSTAISHPHAQHPLQFYATENGDDLQQLVFSAIKNAKNSLFLSSFGLNDPHIIDYLASANALSCTLQLDHKHAPAPQHLPHIQYLPHPSKALMHRKIVLCDGDLAFLGSVNLTPSSLIMHKNSMIGIQDPHLCNAILENRPFITETYQYFPLPETGKAALQCTIQAIDNAKDIIQIALYMLTHPQILQALLRAAERQVTLHLYLDRQTPFSKKKALWKQLQQANASLYVHNEMGLLHHKCALIDHKTLIISSLNWTRNGFSRNTEYLFLCPNLPPSELHKCQSMFRALHHRCKKMPLLN